MGVRTTSAIILRHADERERDRNIVALTPEHGLLRLRARGTKSSTAKLSGSLEPLTEVTLTYADGRTTGVITGAVIRHRFPMLHQDLIALVSAQWLAELVERVTKIGQAVPAVYHILQVSLDKLGQLVDRPSGHRWLQLDLIGIQILEIEGFVPPLNHCPKCQRPMPAERIAYDSHLGFVHLDESSPDGIELSQSTIEVLQGAEIGTDVKNLFREIHPLTESLIMHTFDRRLASQPVLRAVFRTDRLSAASL